MKNTETVIESSEGEFHFDWRELYGHRDLLILLVRKELSAKFRQTLLGPLWFLLQPVLLTLVYLLLFDRIALVPYGAAPAHLFLLLSVPLWNYFAQSLSAVAEGLTSHVALMNKVHFPRLVIPLTAVVWRIVPLGLQLSLFVLAAALLPGESNPLIFSWQLVLVPGFISLLAVLALGVGLCIAAWSIRYKDLQHLFPFLLQLALFVTPVVYPASALPTDWRWLAFVNPAAPFFEGLRACCLGTPWPSLEAFALGIFLSGFLFLFGLVQFQKVERTFVDTI